MRLTRLGESCSDFFIHMSRKNMNFYLFVIEETSIISYQSKLRITSVVLRNFQRLRNQRNIRLKMDQHNTQNNDVFAEIQTNSANLINKSASQNFNKFNDFGNFFLHSHHIFGTNCNSGALTRLSKENRNHFREPGRVALFEATEHLHGKSGLLQRRQTELAELESPAESQVGQLRLAQRGPILHLLREQIRGLLQRENMETGPVQVA